MLPLMSLTDADRRLLRLFTAVVLGDWDRLTHLRREAGPGEPDRSWREAVVQAHLFAGFPRVVEALGVLEEAGGLGEPEPGEMLDEPDRPERGLTLFERIYRDKAAEVRAMLERGHPDFGAWILGHAYGRVLTRPGLSPARRELLAVAALAATGQDRQLAGHARGCLRCGASAEEVQGALESIRDLIPPERYERAERVLERFALPDAD